MGRTILPALFDHAEESFSFNEVQFKKLCWPVNTCTSCPTAEKVTETTMVKWQQKIKKYNN